ncbi:hypothetical protein EXE53_15370 [Halorubrum sp. SD626R]|uniref:hypothetical protein n=1 Tax=Halorubrum sp. SD626R TaxID=1419722 RepID=UPI0010FA3092|nr:hypothetical protein [Halorubrum sp. SD626R]TKX79542.1 hypothetical protein EXE53_15370 [Halorubrum sp. SD626R]
MLDGILLPAAATITAASAMATAGFTAAILRAVKRHDRVLFGEDAVESWNGLVAEVRENKQTLKEEDLR